FYFLVISAFASNRDEALSRKTSRADFWDIDTIMDRAQLAQQQEQPLERPIKIGILSGQDLQQSKATNYTFQEVETDPETGEEKVTLSICTEDLPGTWLGITTNGDLVGLTNYRESKE